MRYSRDLPRRLLRYAALSPEAGGDLLPTPAGFALALGISQAKLALWRNRYPAFAAACLECEAVTCQRLAEGALTRRFDPSFTRFYLQARFGWGDAPALPPTPVEVRVLGGPPLPTSADLQLPQEDEETTCS